jgi:hypothetical protein
MQFALHPVLGAPFAAFRAVIVGIRLEWARYRCAGTVSGWLLPAMVIESRSRSVIGEGSPDDKRMA